MNPSKFHCIFKATKSSTQLKIGTFKKFNSTRLRIQALKNVNSTQLKIQAN